ncbi:MAG: DUF7065 domain-containing protein [Candidatus Thorarchaeota archaeon SMTZ1-45]|nr:MAG: hypothetical protein AM325_14455 [Candidatus Thorarchaeota archaeon SMTZ1-45]
MEPVTHNPSKHIEWNESYYFIFYDKTNRIGGMSRIGFKPNKREGMTFFFLFLPNGSVGVYHANDDAAMYPNSLEVASVRHNFIEDGEWQYSFEGPLLILTNPKDFVKIKEDPSVISDLVGGKIDLKFRAINETYEYSEHMTSESLEIGKKSGDKHWEQMGKVCGTIKVGDEIYDIDGCIGQRDHTHGIRDWTGVGNWFYFVVWFDEKLALNPAAVIMDDGRIGSGGFIYKDGENIPLKTIRMLEHSYQDNGIFPLSTKLELIDDRGQKYILKAIPGEIIPVPFTGDSGNVSFLIQSFGSFQLNDIDGGYGSYEVLRRINQ